MDTSYEIRNQRWQESPPERVDHVIADPPYDPVTHAGGRGNRDGEIVRHEKNFDPIQPERVGPELLERADRWCICFCSLEMFGRYQSAVGRDRYIRSGLWLKVSPTPQISGDRPAQPAEGIAIMHRTGRKRWNGGGHAALWYARAPRGDDRQHETQKPLALMRDLVLDFTEPGDLVWDPFCGAGTTGVAAITHGRDFLGHEKNPEHAETARRRLDAATNGNTLEAADAGQTTLLNEESDA